MAARCWEWPGAIHQSGYGVVKIDSKQYYVPRLSFCIYYSHDYDDKSFVVCHMCHNKRCFNPEHLAMGTKSLNEQMKVTAGRNFNKQKTHCPKGHELNKENTRIWRGTRACKICSRESAMRSYRRRLNG